ncbi:MAG: response regulator [Candidatus Hydrogenedentes bacterium]|nr:response regulator [Candidatus Hydrogenedentota bacterium]
MAKILLADDDASSLEVMAAALAAEGHEVLCAANGQEAHEMTVAERPDLVFLDIMMPVFDGYEACERMRKDPDVPATLPIIFLSSADMDKRKLEQAGGTDHLSKRHMVVELRDMLAKYLGPDARP